MLNICGCGCFMNNIILSGRRMNLLHKMFFSVYYLTTVFSMDMWSCGRSVWRGNVQHTCITSSKTTSVRCIRKSFRLNLNDDVILFALCNKNCVISSYSLPRMSVSCYIFPVCGEWHSLQKGHSCMCLPLPCLAWIKGGPSLLPPHSPGIHWHIRCGSSAG